MKKSKLTPFDAETILMIKSVLGIEPRVEERETRFNIVVPISDNDRAIKEAVAGRFGKRLLDSFEDKSEIYFIVRYEENAEFMPTEVYTDLAQPNKNAGYVYCRRLLEVRALPVKRDNLEKLLMFTGGGTMQIPRTPGGLAVYSFPTENGVMMDVPEGYFIVLMPDGKFAKMDAQTFMANFEEKDTNTAGLTFDEKRLFEKNE